MHVVIFGAPGTGKGTQSKLLEKAGFKSLVASDLIKKVAYGPESEFKAEALKSIECGILVSDEFISSLIKQELQGYPSNQRVIFDGFPRTVGQAEALASIIGNKLSHVIFLSQEENILIARLSGRLVCSCGRSYHNVDYPPKTHGICDDCKGELVRRVDDVPEVIQDRLEIYRKSTAPLYNYFKRKGILHEVSNTTTADECNAIIKDILNA